MALDKHHAYVCVCVCICATYRACVNAAVRGGERVLVPARLPLPCACAICNT